jgi:hypothetical protein
MTPVKSIGLMLLVFAIILFGVHKNDMSTQNQLRAQAHHSAALAYTICTARNANLVRSNLRWGNEKLAWTAAADARRASAKLATPAEAKIDLDAAKTYQAVADSIVPYAGTLCGQKP